MFSTLKKKRSQRYVWELPDGFAGSIQNPKKIIGTSNQPIRMKIHPKKYVYYLRGVKEQITCMGAARQTEFFLYSKIPDSARTSLKKLNFPCTKSILSLLS
jgi:hypothetical protein